MERPISKQCKRNKGVVISLLLRLSFFRVNIRDKIRTPKGKNLRQDFIDGKHLKLVKPIIDSELFFLFLTAFIGAFQLC